MLETKQLSTWKHLTNLWSLITLIIFIAAYFRPMAFDNILSSISVIYAAILAIYVGSKEITRWQSDKYVSKYYGEIYVVVWTMAMLCFVIMAIINPQYKLTSDFTATYITVMGIFAISQKSKSMHG